MSNPRYLLSCPPLSSIQTGQTGGAGAPCTGDNDNSDVGHENAKNGDQNDDILNRAVEEEQGEVILLLLRDPRIDPNQQVLPPWCYKIGLALDECL